LVGRTDPSVGGEIRKTRPAVVVSIDAANRALNRIQVVPLMGKIAKVYPAQAAVTLEGRQSKAAADQIATVSKLRLRGRIGRLDLIDVAAVDRAISTQLAL
jgi:mRNA interferase MazF